MSILKTAWRCVLSLGGAFLATLTVPVMAEPRLQVVGYELASQKRLSATVFEYAYRIQVLNMGTAAQDIEITLRAAPTGVKPVQRVVMIETLDGGAIGTSASRVVVQHDRRYPFRFDQLAWALRARDPSFAGVLPGAAGASALSATSSATVRQRPFRFIVDAEGNRVDLMGMSLRFSTNATVGQVNAAIASIGARIVGMGLGDRVLDLAIPDAGSLDGLNTLLSRAAAAPGIVAAFPSLAPQPATLPPNPAYRVPTNPAFYAGAGSAAPHSRFIDELLAIRAPAAWNLAGLLETPALASRRPVMVYEDKFTKDEPPDWEYSLGDGGWLRVDTSRRLWNTLTIPSDFAIPVPALPLGTSTHGYSVMSAVSAGFGGDDTPAGLVTGIYPVEIESRVINLNRFTSEQSHRELVDLLALYTTESALPSNVILNTSTGMCKGAYCTSRQRAQSFFRASRLIESVRARLLGADGSPSFLHVYSAGNEPDKWAYEDEYGAADANLVLAPPSVDPIVTAFHPGGKLASVVMNPARPALSWDGIRDENLTAERRADGTLVLLDKLPNMLAVESRGNTYTQLFAFPGDPAKGIPPSTRQISPVAGCPSPTTSTHGSIAGLGGNRGRADFWALSGATGPASGGTGTSFASPQVAGAAAWVWSLVPALKSPEVRRLIVATTSNAGMACGDETPYSSPVDVYAAALASDNPYPAGDPRFKNLGNTPFAPARSWLLDVATVDAAGNLVNAPDGKFTQADILKFLQEFEKRRGDMTPDYSRYDLNGNGVTGETAFRQDLTYMARFDLDGNLDWTFADKAVESVAQRFREDLTTDLEVLVYYAYSPLYQGNEYERTLMLLPYLNALPGPASLFLSQMGIQVPPPNLRSTTIGMTSINQLGSTFTSVCGAGAERGAPLYSATISAVRSTRGADAQVFFWEPLLQSGRLQEKAPNAANCSSFVAALPALGLVWANSAVRHRDTAAGTDEEYQTRFFFGEPDLSAGPGTFVPTPRRLATQIMTYGTVAAPSAAFSPMFTTRVFSLTAPTFVPGQ